MKYFWQRARLAKGKCRAFSLTGISVCGECGRPLVGSTGHGRTKEIRYYVHRPLEGYLNGIEKTFPDLYASENASSGSRKRNLERTVAQADVDIKRVIKTKIQTEDKDLREHYSAQLKEVHEERKADMEQLELLNRTPSSSAPPSAMREAVGSNMKHFQKAWVKASPSFQKQLIRAVVHSLVFRIDCIDLFYNTDKVTEIILPNGQESGSTGASPMDLAFTRQAKADRSAASALGLSGFTHYKKVSGWDINKSGCGERI